VAPTDCAFDGGMAVNDWLMQFLADILRMPVVPPADGGDHRPRRPRLLAAAGRPSYASLEEIGELWRMDKRASSRPCRRAGGRAVTRAGAKAGGKRRSF